MPRAWSACGRALPARAFLGRPSSRAAGSWAGLRGQAAAAARTRSSRAPPAARRAAMQDGQLEDQEGHEVGEQRDGQRQLRQAQDQDAPPPPPPSITAIRPSIPPEHRPEERVGGPAARPQQPGRRRSTVLTAASSGAREHRRAARPAAEQRPGRGQRARRPPPARPPRTAPTLTAFRPSSSRTSCRSDRTPPPSQHRADQEIPRLGPELLVEPVPAPRGTSRTVTARLDPIPR